LRHDSLLTTTLEGQIHKYEGLCETKNNVLELATEDGESYYWI